MEDFKGFGLSPTLCKSLDAMHYKEPTPIQEMAIPLALQGLDILGSAQTGTGKTAAFSIPMIESLLRAEDGAALVMTPTRELAKQVLDVVHQMLGPKSPIKTAFIIGGDSMSKQLSQLKARPRIIVGTPGRILDHLERGSLKLKNAGFLVLDETDRMMDMGFGIQLDKILKYLPEVRQTLMFSATLPKEIIKLSDKYLTDPERVAVGATNVIAPKIQQEVIRIEQNEKYQELLTQLHERNGSVIIFIKTKHGADRMAKNLCRDGFDAEALHGDLKQRRRDRVMKDFRDMKFRVMIATDIAARGLDVPHIEHVINYDLPQVAEDYIHRMGRTARAGAEGSALSFVASHDGRKWNAIIQLIDPDSAANDRGSPQGNNKKKKKPRNTGSDNKSSHKGDKSRFDKRSDARPDKKRRNRDDVKVSKDRRDDEKSFSKKKSFARNSDDRPSLEQKENRNSSHSRNGKPMDGTKENNFSKKKAFAGKGSERSRKWKDSRDENPRAREEKSPLDKREDGARKQTRRNQKPVDGIKGNDFYKKDFKKDGARKTSKGPKNTGRANNSKHRFDGNKNKQRKVA